MRLPSYLTESKARVIKAGDVRGTVTGILSYTHIRNLGMAKNDEPVRTRYFLWSFFTDMWPLPESLDRFRIAFEVQQGYPEYRLFRAEFRGEELFFTEDAILQRIFAREKKFSDTVKNIEMSYAEKELLVGRVYSKIFGTPSS
jgi:hypothetical protein